ncbi:MAG: aminotransferase class III-fold pyridoxal phosphate-dependent enzyme, partial [Anaerotignum sp.]|nr:aminotransferase class III-fold pyridoxal phosphate-dependent enzyme [Anaerotignum sp.]
GGGLPIGAVLFGEKTQEVLVPGDHGSTFGGNPVVCAGAAEILSRMSDAFLADVQAKGEYLKAEIEKMPHVTGVSGMGMMLGIERDVDVKPLVTELMEKGLLVLTAKHKMRLLPPLNITCKELKQGLTILNEVLSNI